MSTPTGAAGPYGPQSAAIRRFLVQFAGLGAADRAQIVAAYERHANDAAWQAAERLLGDVVQRSERGSYQQALSGPLLQLVRVPGAPSPTDEQDALATLDPVAEPALAALLALLVRDLLPAATVDTLLSPFAGLLAPE